jgi:hypothetical protein
LFYLFCFFPSRIPVCFLKNCKPFLKHRNLFLEFNSFAYLLSKTKLSARGPTYPIACSNVTIVVLIS